MTIILSNCTPLKHEVLGGLYDDKRKRLSQRCQAMHTNILCKQSLLWHLFEVMLIW